MSEKAELIAARVECETDRAALIRALADGINELLGMSGAAVMLIDAEKEHLHGQAGRPAEVWPEIKKVRVGLDDMSSIAVVSIKTHSVVAVGDAHQDPRGKKWLVRLYGVKSELAYPILFGDEVLGSIIVIDTERCHDFTDEEIAAGELIAGRAAAALKRMASPVEREDWAPRDFEAGALRYRSFLAGIPEVIVMISPDGTVLEVNDRAERYLSAKTRELVGLEFSSLVLGSRVKGLAATAIAGTVPAAEVIEEHGEALSWTIRKVTGADREPAGFLLIGREIGRRPVEDDGQGSLDDFRRELGGPFETGDILHKAVGMAIDLLGCDGAVAFIQVNDNWKIGASKGLGPGPPEGYLIGDDGALIERIVRSGEPLMVEGRPDKKFCRAMETGRDLRSMMVWPLSEDGVSLGALVFANYAGGKWSGTQRDLAGALVAVVSPALKRANVYREKEFALQDARALQRIAARISETLAVEKILDVGLEEAMRALDTSHGCIYVSGADGALEIRAATGLTQNYLADKGVVSLGEGCAGAAARDQEVFAPSPDERGFACLDSKRLLGLDCLAAIPLVSKGETLGVIEFFAPAYRRLSSREKKIAIAIANLLAAALDNARIYEKEKELSEKLSEAKEFSEALNEINAAINSTLDADKIMLRVMTVATEAIGAGSAAIELRAGGGWAVMYKLSLPGVAIGRPLTGSRAYFAEAVAADQESIVIEDVLNDPRVDRANMERAKLRSLVAIPIIIRDEVTGVLFFNHHERTIYSPRQLDFAEKLGAAVSLALENARVYAGQRAIADTLQQVLLTVPETVPGIDFNCFYQSATEVAEVGGDFYDIFELEHDRVGVIIGDVSGKGLQAAGLTSLVKDTIKAYSFIYKSPAAVLDRTNQVILQRTADSPSFVTVFFAVLDKTTGELFYSGAGHPPPLLVTARREITALRVGSPVLGIFSGITYVDHRAGMGRNDLLVGYTDGLIEARRDKKLYGEVRLMGLVEQEKDPRPESVNEAITQDLLAFSGGKLADDVAILTIKYHGPQVHKKAA